MRSFSNITPMHIPSDISSKRKNQFRLHQCNPILLVQEDITQGNCDWIGIGNFYTDIVLPWHRFLHPNGFRFQSSLDVILSSCDLLNFRPLFIHYMTTGISLRCPVYENGCTRWQNSEAQNTRAEIGILCTHLRFDKAIERIL